MSARPRRAAATPRRTTRDAQGDTPMPTRRSTRSATPKKNAARGAARGGVKSTPRGKATSARKDRTASAQADKRSQARASARSSTRQAPSTTGAQTRKRSVQSEGAALSTRALDLAADKNASVPTIFQPPEGEDEDLRAKCEAKGVVFGTAWNPETQCEEPQTAAEVLGYPDEHLIDLATRVPPPYGDFSRLVAKDEEFRLWLRLPACNPVEWAAFIGVDLNKERDPDGVVDARANVKRLQREPYRFPSLMAELHHGVLSPNSTDVDGFAPDDVIYVWCTTEPAMGIKPNDPQGVVEVPVIFAVRQRACMGPPDQVGVASVQLGSRPKISNMRAFGFAFEVHVPLELQNYDASKLGNIGRVHVLTSQSRRGYLEDLVNGALSNDEAKQQNFHNFSLTHPYQLFPQIFGQKSLAQLHKEEDTVEFQYTVQYDGAEKSAEELDEARKDGKPERATKGTTVEVHWCKDVDAGEADREWRCIEDMGHAADSAELASEIKALETALREQFQAKRDAATDHYRANESVLDALTEEQKAALQNVHICKFYPEHPYQIRYQESKVVNRFYPEANQVFPELTEADRAKAEEAKVLRANNTTAASSNPNAPKPVSAFKAPVGILGGAAAAKPGAKATPFKFAVTPFKFGASPAAKP